MARLPIDSACFFIIYIRITCVLGYVKFNIPSLTQDIWNTHDKSLKTLLAPLHHELSSNVISPKIAGDQFAEITRNFLATNDEFLQDEKNAEYIKHAPKTLEQARKAKNALRKKAMKKDATPEDRKEFRSAIKAHSALKTLIKKKEKHKQISHQENLYRQDFWRFSKKRCQGSIDDAIQKPTFSKTTADDYYPNKYSTAKPLVDEKIRWFPNVPSESTDAPISFDLNPIRPKLIKHILSNKKATSAPGPDGLMYGLFRKLPCTHHFMSTLYTKLLQTGEPPESWLTSRVSLIYKANSADDPANFRMISLTSCIGKLFHHIIAERTASFLCKNEIIDNSTQKAFLRVYKRMH